MSRKAEFEMPITWIYVILVGGFALFFFATIAFQSADSAKMNNARQVAQYFDDIIEILSEDTNIMGITEDVMIDRFSVIIGEDGRSRVRYNNAEQILKSNVFSKRGLTGQISFWTYPFKTGYMSSSLTFITDQRTNYYFVHHGDYEGLSNALRSELPFDYQEYFEIDFSDASGIIPGNNKVVCLVTVINKIPGICDIQILPEEENYPMYGNIYFSEDLSAPIPYYNYGMAFAAAFSEDKQSFERAIGITEKRHIINGDIMIAKTNELNGTYTNPVCKQRYNSIELILTNIKTQIGTNNPEQFQNNIMQMFNDNDELKANANCEPVF